MRSKANDLDAKMHPIRSEVDWVHFLCLETSELSCNPRIASAIGDQLNFMNLSPLVRNQIII